MTRGDKSHRLVGREIEGEGERWQLSFIALTRTHFMLDTLACYSLGVVFSVCRNSLICICGDSPNKG